MTIHRAILIASLTALLSACLGGNDIKAPITPPAQEPEPYWYLDFTVL